VVPRQAIDQGGLPSRSFWVVGQFEPLKTALPFPNSVAASNSLMGASLMACYCLILKNISALV